MIKYESLREDILSLKDGEVVEFKREGSDYSDYLFVSKVDLEKGEISGRLELPPVSGVNSISIDEVVKGAIRIAKWKNNFTF